jgi:RNA polymerase sigma-70 factor (ECF subfamily)
MESPAGSAMAALYDRTAPWVYGLILRIVRDETPAAAVTARVYDEASRWDGPADQIDRRLLQRAREIALQERAEGEAPAAAGSVVPLVRPAIAATMKDACGRLAPMDREILTLAYFKGCSVRAIAAMVGAPVPDVNARLRRGLASLAAESNRLEAHP